MKVLITGASGLLGRAIKKELETNTNWQVLGLGYSRLNGGLKKVNLLNSAEIIETLTEFKPDVVIHSAAERRPDHVANNKEETMRMNVAATETIATTVSKNGGFMLYISTDYVFDGTKPPYKPGDTPNPLNEYGNSKLLGEQKTLEYCKQSGVLRVPILYGPVEFVKESAVTCLWEVLKNSSKSCPVSNFEIRYPTSVSDVGVVCRQIIDHRQTDPSFSGIWHWRSDDKLTKYEMIEIMSKIFNLPMSHVQAFNEPTANVLRPYNTELDCGILESAGIGHRTPFREEIKKCLQPFV